MGGPTPFTIIKNKGPSGKLALVIQMAAFESEEASDDGVLDWEEYVEEKSKHYFQRGATPGRTAQLVQELEHLLNKRRSSDSGHERSYSDYVGLLRRMVNAMKRAADKVGKSRRRSPKKKSRRKSPKKRKSRRKSPKKKRKSRRKSPKKKSRKKPVKRRKSAKKSSRGKLCKYGRRKDGKCKKKPGPKRRRSGRSRRR